MTPRVVYYAASLLSLLLIAWAKFVGHETNLPPLEPFVRLVINSLFFNLAVSFVLFIKERSEKPLSVKVWAVFAVVGAFLCGLWPVFSGDLMEYLIRGRMVGLYHVSPYQHTPSEISNDLFYPYSTWRNNPDSYGPLFVWIEALPALVFPKSISGTLWFEKMIFMGFMALAIVFFMKIARLPQVGEKYDVTLLFALNPLLIVSTVIDGHNDIVMLAFTITSAYFLMTRRFSRCFLFWTLGFLVKYTVLLVLPFWILIALKEKKKAEGGFPWLFAAREIAVNAALIVLAFAPLWGGKDTFLALIRASSWFYTNTLPYAFHQGLGLLGLSVEPAWIKYGILTAYAFTYGWLLKRCWTMDFPLGRVFFRLLAGVYLLFYLTITIPFGKHYLLWALPWLVLSRWPLDHFLITLYSFAGLFSYFKRMNYLLIIAAFIYFTAVWIQRRRLTIRKEAMG